MTDICKCRGDGCPEKETCYRYTCSEDPLYQAFFAEVPWEDGDCDYYIRVKSKGAEVCSTQAIDS